MRACVLVASLAFLAFSVPVPGSGSGSEAETAVFIALENSWSHALTVRDVAKLESLLAAEFTIIGASSKGGEPVGTRREWMANATKHPWPEHDVELLRVTQHGDTAIVHVVWSAEYPPKSLTPEGGRLSFLITDTWVRDGGSWQVLSRHSSLAGGK